MMRTVRRLVALGLLGGALACAQPAHAQGMWFGGIGFGSPGMYGPGFFGPGMYGPGFASYGFGYPGVSGGFAPYRYGYPAAVRPVYAARPVVYGGAPVYVSRPVVRAPTYRAYRRSWRRWR